MWFSLVLAFAAAHATPCDAAAQAKAVSEATPATVARAWASLAACDAEAARPLAAQAFTAALPGADAHDAVVRAIDLGLDAPVRDWIRRAPSDERSKAIGFLGTQCAAHPPVASFLVATHAAIGPDFWAERWHRGLADCRTPEVQAFLQGSLVGDEVGVKTAVDRAQFFGLLEVYSRNLGAASLPTLQALARELEDESEITFVISAFGNAAGVGSAAGVDFGVATKAVQALEELGPELPPRAVDHARGILLALGDERASDAFAKHRWPAAHRNGGYAYRYSVVAIETSVCNNGKTQSIAHHGTFTEPGDLWPDQVAELLRDKLEFEWQLDGSNVCGGAWAVVWHMPAEPFETAEVQKTWLAGKLATFHAESAGFSKAQVRPHEILGL